jgi:hypothetical protein
MLHQDPPPLDPPASDPPCPGKSSLSPTDRAAIKRALARQQRRRQAHWAGPLRVTWDGVAAGVGR